MRAHGPLPGDDSLPQLDRLLDPEAIVPLLQRCLPAGDHPRAIRVHRVRYEPGVDVTVLFRFKVGGTRQHATATVSARQNLRAIADDPANRSLAEEAALRSPAVDALTFDPDLDALVQWLPLDLSLPAMSMTPQRLGESLGEVGIGAGAGEAKPELLRYEPRRRATLRFGGSVIKAYSRTATYAVAARAAEAVGGLHAVSTARSEGLMPDLRLTVQEFLPDARPVAKERAEEAAGAVLAALHASDGRDLRRYTPGDHLARAPSAARFTQAVAPELRDPTQRLLAELEDGLPPDADLVVSHGDFHRGQLLDTNRGVALVDFDKLCQAPAALDPALYAADLVVGRACDEQVAGALDRLCAAYGGRPPHLSWNLATAVLRLSHFPLRRLSPEWPSKVRAMVVAAQAALRASQAALRA